MAEVACRHHFIVETPNGAPTVTGRCRDCGEVREYPASSYRDAYFNTSHKQEDMAIKPRETTRVFGKTGRVDG